MMFERLVKFLRGLFDKMTKQQTIPENTQVKIACVNCKAVNPMESLIAKRDAAAVGPGVEENGLQCPDCGYWTHSYYMTPALEERRERLEMLNRLYLLNRTQGRWTTYDSARLAYTKEFERVQSTLEHKHKV